MPPSQESVHAADERGMPQVVDTVDPVLAERTSETDLLRLFREVPDAVVLIGPSGVLVWGNATAERLFGTTIAEAKGGAAEGKPGPRPAAARAASTEPADAAFADAP